MKGTVILGSEAAAIGFSALRSVAPIHELDLAAAMQRAFYFEAKNPSCPITYQDIAKYFDLDEQKNIEQFKAPEMINDVKEDFLTVAILGVRSYPTLFLK
ncbi:hypothetical protein ABGV43_00365 [Paenibacillus amylolyticus]|uniref:hypothetical protein n=1 Tax=Paenibacillus amylolyticus TaxID=1451 RepID=UPI003242DDC2